MSADDLIAELRSLGDVKVWSIVVTLLGDTIRKPDDCVAGPAISAVAERLVIQPAALRVALHRLRKDDWIASHKTGRISLYRMTPAAWRETEAVRDHVYAPSLRPCGRLWMVQGPKVTALPDHVPIGSNSVLVGRCPPWSSDYLVGQITEGSVPNWVNKYLIPSKDEMDYTRLLNVLRAAPDPGDFEPTDHTALRILVLHCWRRLVLRTPAFAMTLLPDTAPAHACRAQVAHWLSALPPLEPAQPKA